MKKILIVLLICAITLPAAAKTRIEETVITPMTQLQKRQYQTRVYDVKDKFAVMKAILNTLQDDGYIVYNVNTLLGFIYAVKDFDTSDPNVDISKEFRFTKSRLNYNGVKVATLETTVNITEYGDNARIRINFKRKLLNEYGNAQFIDNVEDASYYEEFYSKVNNALALQKQINSPKQEVPASNIIKDALPASVQDKQEDSEIAVPQKQEKEMPAPENTQPQEVLPAEITDTESTENTPDATPSQAEEAPAQEIETTSEYATKNTAVEEEDEINLQEETTLTKKELKQRAKLEKAMQKELKKQEKYQQKLLKLQEKQQKKLLKESENIDEE